MTINEAVTQVRNLKSNHYDDVTLIRWLSDLDSFIYHEYIVGHYLPKDEDGNELEVGHGPYDPDEDISTELLVPDPYSELYVKYLIMKIDLNNAEYTRYNNSAMMYHEALSAFTDWFNRNFLPKQDHYVRF